MVELETARLRLRRWRDDDLDAYARICADPEVMRYMGGPLTRDETERRIEKIVRGWEERGFGLWAVEDKTSGAFIGRIGLLYHEDWTEGEHKTEVGWLIERSRWGRGLATEGARASVRHGFETLGLDDADDALQAKLLEPVAHARHRALRREPPAPICGI